MTNIEYSPFGTESVIVKFTCDKCGHEVTSEELGVPSPNFSAETASDSYNDNDGFAVCSHCNKEFNITIWASYAGGYIDIDDISDEDVINVIENYEKLDEYYEQQIDAILFNLNSLETFQREITNIKQLNDIAIEDKALEKTFKRQLFSGAVTCMEDYLSDKLINSVLNDDELFKSFVRTFKGIRDRKFSLSEIFVKQEQLKDIVKKELLEIIYHDLPKVKGMYEGTFKIQFPEIADLTKIVLQRHDMVHRNGKSKDGTIIEVSKEIISGAICKVEKLVKELDEKITPTKQSFSKP
ncbi:MAG: hypothetical protein ACYDCN_06560 [Bacteroidia bacterium]